jgi:hypothetical protein
MPPRASGRFARRDIPQADRVDTIRDALYPRHVFYDLHGLPRAEPWTVADVAAMARGVSARAGEEESGAAAASNLVTRCMAIKANNAIDPRQWGASWLPAELTDTGAVKERRRRLVPKPVRRGGTVVIPTKEVKKPTAKAGSDEDGSGAEKSESEDDAISGNDASDDDAGGSGGSGDELTM